MSSNITSESFKDLMSIIGYLRELSLPQRALIPAVCTLASLILVVPVTNNVRERSFSSLHRIKSYPRSTMSQTRLNHAMVLHVHKNHTDHLNLIHTGNEFVKNSPHNLCSAISFNRSIDYNLICFVTGINFTDYVCSTHLTRPWPTHINISSYTPVFS